MTPPRIESAVSLIGAQDLHLFNEGTHRRLYQKLGAHPLRDDEGRAGTYFAVWAPNAEDVSVVGSFNGWGATAQHRLRPVGHSGIWEGFLPGVRQGDLYKYRIASRERGYAVEKADPFAVRAERPPATASIVWDLDYTWGDAKWLERRRAWDYRREPLSIYEVHLGSWRRVPEDGDRPLTYREIGPRLAEYALDMGFTHVELMPLMEHPFYGSWGYQGTGYFAPTSRYGTPQDLMQLVDTLPQAGVGVILDWVPSHFATDEHGLVYFDGTHLYEHADPRQGHHPDWGSMIFNYGRHEVVSFLVSNALYWLRELHCDGLRVDAVASMLYLDYSRKEGEWIPNRYGGRENIEAIDFLRHVNDAIHDELPDVITVAEESTAWGGVSRPTAAGGLGFDMKWDMGWMHDTLEVFTKDPVHRKYHHGGLTFRMLYAFSEDFVLPLSHDEVVHGKGSLLSKMPGDEWQKRANLRLLLASQWAQPGKKLLFMGGELGQRSEWHHETSLEWHLLEDPGHAGIHHLVRRLNDLYLHEPALHRHDFDPTGFEWVDCNDVENSVLSFLRKTPGSTRSILCVFNMTPLVRRNYRCGVPAGGRWRELLNTDAVEHGGSGQGNMGGVDAVPIGYHGRPWSVVLTLPPLAAVWLVHEGEGGV